MLHRYGRLSDLCASPVWPTAALLCILAADAGARSSECTQLNEARVGKWRLVQMKAGSLEVPPSSSVWTYAFDGVELRVDVHSVSETGRPTHWSYITKRDGSEVRVSGHPYLDRVIVTRRNEHVDDIVYKQAGVVTTTGTNEISLDGETLTLTMKSASGNVSVGVYKRMR